MLGCVRGGVGGYGGCRGCGCVCGVYVSLWLLYLL